MHMIRNVSGCVGLSVDELDQKCGTLNSVGMADTCLKCTFPGKEDSIPTPGTFNRFSSIIRDFFWDCINILVDQRLEQRLLRCS